MISSTPEFLSLCGKSIDLEIFVLQVGYMPDENLKAELERLRAENEKLKQQQQTPRAISLKVSEKGGVSVYGLGRFPVTLYKDQWIRLLDTADEIRSFIKENEKRLSVKS